MRLNLRGDTRAVALPIVGLLALAACNAFGQAGKSGFAFLKLGVSGRTVAMADAAIATVSGAAATHYNPAGLLADEPGKTQLMFMHKEWIQDVRTEFLGASLPLDDENAIGLSVNTTNVSNIEIRTRPGPAEGSFTSRDAAVGISYARKMSDDLRLGLTAKALYEKILVTESTGWAIDIGAQYKTPIDNLSIGAALNNIGSASEMKSEKITLPSTFRIGPAYGLTFDELHATGVIGADIFHIFPEGKTYLNAGGEFVFNHILSVRLGYQFGSKARGFAAGVGMQYGMFALDYAFTPLTFDLGSGHTFSLTLSL